MRKMVHLLAPIAVAATALAALALDAASGSTVTPLFRAVDVQTAVQYPTGFSGVRWDDPDVTRFELGQDAGRFLATNSGGDLFFMVIGRTGSGVRLKGLIHWDGTDFVHLLQEAWGTRIESVTVSPVTAGALTAGHPVVVKKVTPPGGTSADAEIELWSVDPTTSPATQTLVHHLTAATQAGDALIDEDGTIYVSTDWTSITKLAFDGTGYDESVFATGLYPNGVLGPDGAIYAFAADARWGFQSGGPFQNDLLRVDPVTGATSVHASVQGRDFHLRTMVWDRDGRLWLALLTTSDSTDIVTEIVAGQTLSKRNAKPVAETGNSLLRTLVGGLPGELIVAEWTTHLADAETEVFSVLPAAGGGGGGGNGNGKGKGKNK